MLTPTQYGQVDAISSMIQTFPDSKARNVIITEDPKVPTACWMRSKAAIYFSAAYLNKCCWDDKAFRVLALHEVGHSAFTTSWLNYGPLGDFVLNHLEDNRLNTFIIEKYPYLSEGFERLYSAIAEVSRPTVEINEKFVMWYFMNLTRRSHEPYLPFRISLLSTDDSLTVEQRSLLTTIEPYVLNYVNAQPQFYRTSHNHSQHQVALDNARVILDILKRHMALSNNPLQELKDKIKAKLEERKKGKGPEDDKETTEGKDSDKKKTPGKEGEKPETDAESSDTGAKPDESTESEDKGKPEPGEGIPGKGDPGEEAGLGEEMPTTELDMDGSTPGGGGEPAGEASEDAEGTPSTSKLSELLSSGSEKQDTTIDATPDKELTDLLQELEELASQELAKDITSSLEEAEAGEEPSTEDAKAQIAEAKEQIKQYGRELKERKVDPSTMELKPELKEKNIAHTQSSGEDTQLVTDFIEIPPQDLKVYKVFIQENGKHLAELRKLFANSKYSTTFEQSKKSVASEGGHRLRSRAVARKLANPHSATNKLFLTRSNGTMGGQSTCKYEDVLQAIDSSGSMGSTIDLVKRYAGLVHLVMHRDRNRSLMASTMNDTPYLICKGAKLEPEAIAIAKLCSIRGNGDVDLANGSVQLLRTLQRLSSKPEFSRLIIHTDCCAQDRDWSQSAAAALEIGYPTCIMMYNRSTTYLEYAKKYYPKAGIIHVKNHENIQPYLQLLAQWMSNPQPKLYTLPNT